MLSTCVHWTPITVELQHLVPRGHNVNGSLVWDKEYVYRATSDGTGKFRIAYDVGSSAHVIATRAGYQPYDGWHESNSAITIRLKQNNANYQPLPNGILELGMRDSKPFGWVFSTAHYVRQGRSRFLPRFAGFG